MAAKTENHPRNFFFTKENVKFLREKGKFANIYDHYKTNDEVFRYFQEIYNNTKLKLAINLIESCREKLLSSDGSEEIECVNIGGLSLRYSYILLDNKGDYYRPHKSSKIRDISFPDHMYNSEFNSFYNITPTGDHFYVNEKLQKYIISESRFNDNYKKYLENSGIFYNFTDELSTIIQTRYNNDKLLSTLMPMKYDSILFMKFGDIKKSREYERFKENTEYKLENYKQLILNQMDTDSFQKCKEKLYNEVINSDSEIETQCTISKTKYNKKYNDALKEFQVSKKKMKDPDKIKKELKRLPSKIKRHKLNKIAEGREQMNNFPWIYISNYDILENEISKLRDNIYTKLEVSDLLYPNFIEFLDKEGITLDINEYNILTISNENSSIEQRLDSIVEIITYQV